MSRIGGETAAKNVYNIMWVVISHDLSLKLRFTDQSGKEPFGKTLIAKAIRGKHEKFETFQHNSITSLILSFIHLSRIDS